MAVRLRQAVLAAADLDAVAGRLRAELGLGEPYSDPGVGLFGLRNAVFALGDQFLEVVSPMKADTAAGRWLERRGGDGGYMVMLQVDDVAAARERARALGVREVWAIELDDIAEVHLHPADMRGAIVSLSQPTPSAAWRWGGPAWERRSADGQLDGVRIAVAKPDEVQERWGGVLGVNPAEAGVAFTEDESERGLIEVETTAVSGHPVEVGGVRFAATD